MPLVVADRVRETSNTTGTGTLTLAGAVTGFQTFTAGIGNGNTTYYSISNPNNNEWEVGIGTVGSGTLTRDTVLDSSNANALVNFTAGPLDVFCTYPANKSINLNENNNVQVGLGWDEGTGRLQVTGNSSFDGTVTDRQLAMVGGNNLLTFSEQFDNAAWTKATATVTANSTVAPDGTVTADTISISSNLSNVSQVVSLGAGTYTFSVWVKTLTFTTPGALRLLLVVDGGTQIFTFTPTANWVRYSFTVTAATSVTQVQAVRGSVYVGDVAVWGAQLEVGNTVSPYTATTTTAVTTSNDVYVPNGTVRNGTWNQGTGALQITGNTSVNGTSVNRNVQLAGGNNLFTFSDQFDNAAWTKSSYIVVGNITTAPDGTLTADKVIPNSGLDPSASNATGLSFNLAVTSGIFYVYSIYAKAAELNVLRYRDGGVSGAFLDVNLLTGSITNGNSSRFLNVVAQSLSNGWYRVSFATPSISNANLYMARAAGQIGDGTSGIFIWGAQLELGTVASAYTPTTTTAVTVSNQFLATNGFQATPSYSFATEPGLGFYRIANNQLATVVNNKVVYGVTSSDFQVSSTQTIGWGSNANALFAASDVVLARDAADTLAQRRGVNAQTYNLYNTFTDTSNYERFAITWSGNQLQMNTQALGTGTVRSIGLQTTGGGTVSIGTTTIIERLTVGNGSIALDNTRGITIRDNAGTPESVISLSSANNLAIAAPTLSGSIQYSVRNASGSHQFSTGGSERMRINNAGNVGIGTASPVNEFEVYGTGQPRITVRTVESISEALEIGFQFGTAANASTNTLALIRSVPTQVDPNPIIADLAFSTNSGDNVAERMRITGAGNVGIGTTSPVSIGGTTGILTLYGSNATALVLGNSAGTGVYFTKTGNDLNIRNTEAGYIRLTTSDTERMRVKSTGSVRFVPLASAPAGPEAGDVYYDSTTNKLRCYNGTTWNDLF